MRRRSFIAAITGAVCATAARAEPVTEEGRFAELFNHWVTLHWQDEHGSPTINAEAFRLWPEVKKAEREMEKHIDRQYGW